MKKILSSIITSCLILSPFCSVYAVDAIPTESMIFVDGQRVEFDAYNIDGNNYFKLRDIAYMLSGTSKQFDIGYDLTTDSIYLTSNKTYTVVGGEMQKGGSDVQEASSTDSKLIKDGAEIEMASYNINDNNYFKLRDLGEKFNFGVNYNESTNSVAISTDKEYNETVESSNKTDSDGFGIDLFTTNDPSTRPTPVPPPIFYMP